RQPLLTHVANADWLLRAQGDTLYAIPRAEIKFEAQVSVDRCVPFATLTSSPKDEHAVAHGTQVTRALSRAFQHAALGTAAQLVGLARRALDMAVDYAKTRTQFGVAIGSQQAIKHHLANALIQQEFARPLVIRAAWSLAEHDAQSALHVS